ncbi:MAG: class I SAM-dependent methyltransferase [Clostridia bacterium]|nr:class I SAM-dependent methyltransferase [Clostridia bacterium]
MSSEAYGATFSEVYDRLNNDVDADSFAHFSVKCFESFPKTEVKHVCEIACGTGSVAIQLEKRGYKVTASDLSEQMLAIADNKAFEAGCKNVIFTKQDMRSFTASNKAGAVICFLDSINCLLTPKDVKACFDSAYNILVDGGVFVFDINSKYKFEKVYGENAYILEDEGVLCAWQNFYDEKTKICQFYLSFFTENEQGLYQRSDEEKRERMYTLKNIMSYLKTSGFENVKAFGDVDFNEADENKDERVFFVAVKP